MPKMLKTLLIVDDSPPIRRLIRNIVAGVAGSIYECEDGSEAIEAYEQYSPDCVLMDVEMAGVDGITATRELIESHPEARIVVLTKFDSDRIRDEAMRAGAVGFVPKADLISIRHIVQNV